jgi:hypothetical protein
MRGIWVGVGIMGMLGMGGCSWFAPKSRALQKIEREEKWNEEYRKRTAVAVRANTNVNDLIKEYQAACPVLGKEELPAKKWELMVGGVNTPNAATGLLTCDEKAAPTAPASPAAPASPGPSAQPAK